MAKIERFGGSKMTRRVQAKGSWVLQQSFFVIHAGSPEE